MWHLQCAFSKKYIYFRHSCDTSNVRFQKKNIFSTFLWYLQRAFSNQKRYIFDILVIPPTCFSKKIYFWHSCDTSNVFFQKKIYFWHSCDTFNEFFQKKYIYFWHSWQRVFQKKRYHMARSKTVFTLDSGSNLISLNKLSITRTSQNIAIAHEHQKIYTRRYHLHSAFRRSHRPDLAWYAPRYYLSCPVPDCGKTYVHKYGVGAYKHLTAHLAEKDDERSKLIQEYCRDNGLMRKLQKQGHMNVWMFDFKIYIYILVFNFNWTCQRDLRDCQKSQLLDILVIPPTCFFKKIYIFSTFLWYLQRVFSKKYIYFRHSCDTSNDDFQKKIFFQHSCDTSNVRFQKKKDIFSTFLWYLQRAFSKKKKIYFRHSCDTSNV